MIVHLFSNFHVTIDGNGTLTRSPTHVHMPIKANFEADLWECCQLALLVEIFADAVGRVRCELIMIISLAKL